ncbi:cation acetate symporter [Nesterenkonia rhizosphaerae]|uniref:Cation acetate symporter n=1 Tax=Nesterenkonia rhizosphaerae TaxID=1348272 RepID=A0ABP9FPR5_9MICC
MTYTAVLLICAVTLALAFWGLRLRRTTGDFYVASRRVSPWMNAAAIAGEYLSAASFLGVIGLIVSVGALGLWLPLGYAAGFVMLLVFVAAPLRRSGAYTLPDFMMLRFRSAALRRITALVVVVLGWFYVVPQLHGAALVTDFATALPGWTGAALVVGLVLAVVLSGGMRSVTLAQAVQYWIKLTALLIPAIFIALRWDSVQHTASGGGAGAASGAVASLSEQLPGDPLVVFSLVLALSLGALGLPHVLVRFYTNPDGASARSTVTVLLALLGLFYLITVFLGVTAALVLPDDDAAADADTALLQLPAVLFDPLASDVLLALLAAGAFAAFLSTASGLVVSVSAVVSQELFGGSVAGFRWGAVIAVVVPVLLTVMTASLGLAGAVAMVFTMAASTVAPVMLLGIWWQRMNSAGAVAAMLTGGAASTAALLSGILFFGSDAPVLLAYPGVWSIPLAFCVAVTVSLATAPMPSAAAVVARLHLPEG